MQAIRRFSLPTGNRLNNIYVPRLLFFVLHDVSGQTFLAASYTVKKVNDFPVPRVHIQKELISDLDRVCKRDKACN